MKQLREIAKEVGQDWIEAPYFDEAEKCIDVQWDGLVWPFIQGNDFSNTIDLAAGHGRNTRKLINVAGRITVVDINEENIEYCRSRFTKNRKIKYLLTDGVSLSGIADNSISFIYCFDSMVHFDSDIIRSYLREFQRVLIPGGRGFCHHSNYTKNPEGSFRDNPGWRNYMSDSLFAHYCHKIGLGVIKQKVLDWDYPDLDCFTLFEKK